MRVKSEKIESIYFAESSGLSCWETGKEVLLPITQLGKEDTHIILLSAWNRSITWLNSPKKPVKGHVEDNRGAFYQYPFRQIYYCHSSKSTKKKTGKTHLCAIYRSLFWGNQLIILLLQWTRSWLKCWFKRFWFCNIFWRSYN